MLTTTLLIIIVVLLFILVLAIEPARQLFLSGGLLISGIFLIVFFWLSIIAISFSWNFFEHSLTHQIFWWIELFVVVCGTTVIVGNLSFWFVYFARLVLQIIMRTENKELRGSIVDIFAVPWFLSWFIFPISTVLTSMGILIYQIYGYVAYDDWRELSIIDSIVYSFYGTTFARLLVDPILVYRDTFIRGELLFIDRLLYSVFTVMNFVGGFLSAWVGVIILGVVFLFIHLLITHFMHLFVCKVTGEDPLDLIGK